jgi:protein phosphatase
MTHVGRYRQNNEDSFLALTYDAREVRYLGKIGDSTLADGDFVFAVSDGMGGAKSGEFASRMVVQQVMRLMPRSYKQAAQGLDSGYGDVLDEICHKVHAELNTMGKMYSECTGMGATLSLTCFTPGLMHFPSLSHSSGSAPQSPSGQRCFVFSVRRIIAHKNSHRRIFAKLFYRDKP